MTTSPIFLPPLPDQPAPSTQKTLRLLFLTLFLRGRSSRGLKKQDAPKSIAQKLLTVLTYYFLFGFMALVLIHQPIFALSVYLHAMTFVFLGMFVASSAGEVLFNKDEADILLHRPIDPRSLLLAKVRMLVDVSLWLAFAFNLVGFFVGALATTGSWEFVIAHALSLCLEAVFCVGCVVLVYQLCLRWFGRERLDSLMTTAQVAVSMAAILSGQILPQFVFGPHRATFLGGISWWILLLPPAWFAGLDDVIAGGRSRGSWLLAALAIAITAIVLIAAFGKLARDYELGLQTLSESVQKRPGTKARRRWLDALIDVPPFRWWLRNPVERAAFLLAAAYLLRDRDVKLRIYPAVAPFMALPLIFIVNGHHRTDGGMDSFGVGMTATYLGVIPLMAVSVLQFSQQWQASDIFRIAPIPGPGPLCHGGRRAILLLLALPATLIVMLIVAFSPHGLSHLPLLIPGVISLPIFAMTPNLGGTAVPLSRPTEEAKSASRGLTMMVAMFCSMLLAGLSYLAWTYGIFGWFIAGETTLAASIYLLMRRSVASATWQSIE